jgi:hypothetical protein
MKHLYIVVEGETELEFVNRLLIPYLISRGLNTNLQGLMITFKGGGHGFNNIEHLKKTIEPLLYYENQPIITTMIDYYGINSEQKLPNYTNCVKEQDIEQRILCMEKSLSIAIQEIRPEYRFFIPNIVRHEMETLLFADPKKGFDLEDEIIKQAILEVIKQYPNIEDINSNPETAPSKRLMQIYAANGKKYVKGADAIDIAELTGINIILEKCPRFKKWVELIIETLNKT